MRLNLLVHLDNFRWKELKQDRSAEILQLAETIETLADCQDKVWHHPDCYSLCYEWGCLHELLDKNPKEIRAMSGWIEHIHFKTLLKFWTKVALNQTPPFCRNIADLRQNHVNRINGILGFLNDLQIIEFVSSPKSRYELIVYHFSHNNHLINWHATNGFLPNINYSNLFLAEQKNSLNSDLRQRTLEVPGLAKAYCDEEYKSDCGIYGKESNAARVGSEVARRNFYKEEKALSSQEQKLRKSLRSIFSIEKDGKKLYLSIDFEKANCFELCDHKGKHLGEYRFDGIFSSNADSSGKHDIYVLRDE